MKVRSPFSRCSVALTCSTPSRTQQNLKSSCDISNIIARYQSTGTALPTVDPSSYVDFSNAPDYISALNVVARATEEFNAMPSHIRKRFSNSPSEFVSFVMDKSNLPELRKLGLALPEVVDEVPVEPSSPPRSRSSKAPVDSDAE